MENQKQPSLHPILEKIKKMEEENPPSRGGDDFIKVVQNHISCWGHKCETEYLGFKIKCINDRRLDEFTVKFFKIDDDPTLFYVVGDYDSHNGTSWNNSSINDIGVAVEETITVLDVGVGFIKKSEVL